MSKPTAPLRKSQKRSSHCGHVREEDNLPLVLGHLSQYVPSSAEQHFRERKLQLSFVSPGHVGEEYDLIRVPRLEQRLHRARALVGLGVLLARQVERPLLLAALRDPPDQGGTVAGILAVRFGRSHSVRHALRDDDLVGGTLQKEQEFWNELIIFDGIVVHSEI